VPGFERLLLGYISRSQGIQGEIRVVLDYPELLSFGKGKTVYLEKEGTRFSYDLISIRWITPSEASLKFKQIKDRDQADSLIGSTLLFPLTLIPNPPKGEWYPFELPGMAVIDERLGDLGLVEEVYRMPAQDLLALKYQGQEVLVPITPDFVKHLDREKSILTTCLPEGLLEVYLAPESEEAEEMENAPPRVKKKRKTNLPLSDASK
jgi:16S rRNA processing protein RimM